MLAAAQSPPVVLLPQTRSVPDQRKQLDAYNGSASMIVSSPAASPVSVSISLPVTVPVSTPMPVQLPMPMPMPASLPVQQRVEGPSLVPPQERLFAAQLAHLASQHHTSEYSRFKHGQKGAPVAYVPLSLHAPAQVRELRAKQAYNAEQRAWWISNGTRYGRRPEKPFLSVAQEEKISPALIANSSSDISEEISAAISSQMITTHITKTSQSHPINISMVIPSEAIPGIVSRLVQTTTPTPVMFHLPEVYYLNHLTAISAHNPFYRSEDLSYSSFARPPVSVSWAEQGSSELEKALNAELVLLPPRPFAPSQERRCIRSPPKSPLWKLPMQVPTPPNLPRGVVRRRQRNGRAKSAPPAFRTLKGIRRRVSDQKDLRLCFQRNGSSPKARNKRLDDFPTPLSSLSGVMCSARHREDEFFNDATGKVLMLPPASVTASLSSPAAVVDATSREDTTFTRRLGNLYLSSCPGKKVRLSGPVKGRSTICRDLRVDLARIKELGVGCVICCLDDNELEFLGASWPDYSRVANELDLDVLRIPMPEGLGPLSPAALDAHLECIIESYTLHGVSVLAHCRGGVGRAGLVACCWMLKLGLCGWKDQQICKHSCGEHATCNQSASEVPDLQTMHTRERSEIYIPMTSPVLRSRTQNSPTGFMSVPRVCRATLSLVERVLAVVRRRRSLKAVETYEQVRFLVEFIEYLDAEARQSVEISDH